jgi:hypothetical protein
MVQTFLRVYTFCPGCTLISVGRMAQGEKWSRLRNQNNPSSLFVKNREDSPLLMRADILSDLTNVSERLAQRIQFIFNNIFLCRMASDDCYGDYLSPDSRDILLWWICSTVREADILSELTDVSERLAQTNQFIS